MLKNILNLKGAQQLTKGEQKNINGGGKAINFDIPKCFCVDTWFFGDDCQYTTCAQN